MLHEEPFLKRIAYFKKKGNFHMKIKTSAVKIPPNDSRSVRKGIKTNSASTNPIWLWERKWRERELVQHTHTFSVTHCWCHFEIQFQQDALTLRIECKNCKWILFYWCKKTAMWCLQLMNHDRLLRKKITTFAICGCFCGGFWWKWFFHKRNWIYCHRISVGG